MKNTLKPLPDFMSKEKAEDLAKENSSEQSYKGELRYAYREGYNEARKEFQRDTERLDWLEKSDYELYEPNTDSLFAESSREAIDEAMQQNDSSPNDIDNESKLDILAKKVMAAGLDNADYTGTTSNNTLMKEPTLEEIKKLVSFKRDSEGNLKVLDVEGDVEGSVRGHVKNFVYGNVGRNVGGNVCGFVYGSVLNNVIKNKL